MRTIFAAMAVAAVLTGALSAPAQATPPGPLPAVAVVPSPTPAPGTYHVTSRNLAVDGRVHVRGVIQIVDATSSVSASGVATPEVADAAYLLVGETGRIRLAGSLPTGVHSGATFDGTLAVARQAASTQATVDAATSNQTPLAIADATIVVQAETVAPTPMAHTFYVAVVGAYGSRYKSSSYSTTSVKTLTKRVSDYWKAQSGGAVSSITVKQVVHYSSSTSCSGGQASVSKWWSAAAKHLGHPSSFFAAGTGRHLVVLVPDGTSAGPCAAKLHFVGLASVGSGSTSGGFIQVIVGSSIGTPSLAHEFGHNISLAHADVQFCASETQAEASATDASTPPCTTSPYEDYYDVMGASMYGQSGIPSLSLPQKDRLGFVTGLTTVGAGSTVTTTINAVSLTSGLRGLKVIDPKDPTTTYWIEYRAPVGQDSSLAAYRNGFSVCKSNCSAAASAEYTSLYGAGVRVLKLNSSASPNETVAVGTPSASNARWHSLARTTGGTFTSMTGAVHVTVNSVTATSASVTVTVDGN
ncbi:MAG: hypothetical protein JWQ12_1914 [Glaciihabitans sp.]|nr:hypothetical protein [Glaciihabitans sp.]